MKNISYVLSYDFGTSGVKAVVVDTAGNVHSCTTSSYRLYTPEPGWGEQETEEYWNAVCAVTKEALGKISASPDLVRGIVFGTMWKCVIPVDDKGNVLHRSIIWLDGRAGRQADELNKRLNVNIYCDKDYIPRLMWIKDNLPEKVVAAFVKYSFEDELDASRFSHIRDVSVDRKGTSRLFVARGKEDGLDQKKLLI